MFDEDKIKRIKELINMYQDPNLDSLWSGKIQSEFEDLLIEYFEYNEDFYLRGE